MGDPTAQRGEQPGYSAIGTDGNYARKMRERADAGLGEAQATLVAAKRLTRTVDEVGFDKPFNERRIFDLAGVTRGLGLDNVDEQRVQALVRDTPAGFDPKSQPKMMQALAKITMALRRSWHIPSEARVEITKRARSYYANTQTTDYGDKEPSLRYEPYKVENTNMPKARKNPKLVIRKAEVPIGNAQKPPPGFMVVPKSKKGAYKSPDGKQYWYPDGKGVRGAPAAGDEDKAAENGHPDDALTTYGHDTRGTTERGSKVTPPSGGVDGGKAPKFEPAPKGMSADDEQLHHRKAAYNLKALHDHAKAKGDAATVAATKAAVAQHKAAYGEAVKRGAAEFASGTAPNKPGEGQVPGAQGGQEGAEGASDDQEGGEDQGGAPGGAQDASSGGQPMQGGAGNPADEAALTGDPRAGLERTSSGVTMKDGNRVTAANDRKRIVPEAELVRSTREKLGRAVNVMADLSAAYDDVSEQKSQLAQWKASSHPLRKQAIATLKASIAASMADIEQLKSAHGEAMKDVAQAQNDMRAAKMKASPIFQAFAGLMAKIGQTAEVVGGKIKDAKAAHDEEVANEKTLAGQRQQMNDVFNRSTENPTEGLPPSKASGTMPKKGRAVAMDSPVHPQAAQAHETLARLAAQDDEAPDVEEVDADYLGDDEGELSEQDIADAKALKQNPAKVEDFDRAAHDAEQTKHRAMMDKLEEEGVFTHAGMQEQQAGDSGVRRKGGANDDKATVAGKKGASGDEPQESAFQRKNRLMRERMAASKQGAQTVAKSMVRRNGVPLERIVKSDAWGIAIQLGMQASHELRVKSAMEHPLKLVVKAQPRRRVSYFFNEL